MNVAVIIATYGEESWRDLAMSRAYPSAVEQLDAKHIFVVHREDGTLALARNEGAAQAVHEFNFGPDWLCFLDADDELAPGYIDAMTRAEGEGFGPRLLVPQIQYVRPACCGKFRYDRPRFPKELDGDYHDVNGMVIGTLIQRQLFWEIGGFEEWPMYEDWALFARAQKAGAEPVRVPEAIYVAYRQRARSRNHQGRNAALAAHDAIRRAVFPELYEGAEDGAPGGKEPGARQASP